MNNDLISRSDALKAVDIRHEELLHDTEYRRKHCQIDLWGIKKHILAIPPANILNEERPQGEWINKTPLNRYAECSECHYWNSISRYCPECGADMRGGAE